MSTWEERMSARAQVRIRAEQKRERIRIEAEMAAEEAERRVQLEGQRRAMLEAGPPGGCCECWSLIDGKFGLGWLHGDSVQPGPAPDGYADYGDDTVWCWHPCHGGEPAFCGPIAMASCG